MEKVIPIVTDLGVLRGRDCIYLNFVEQDDIDNMTLSGDINGALVDIHEEEKEWFPYQLMFRGVLACFFCELDTYEDLVGTEDFKDSCFNWIEDSVWLQSLPIRQDFEKSKYTHYCVFTYDIVYHIIAVAYQLEIDI